MSKITWRPEPVDVEKSLDDLWIEVKCQSNREISGSPRNDFRVSLEVKESGGRALFRLGVSPTLPNLGKLRMPDFHTQE